MPDLSMNDPRVLRGVPGLAYLGVEQSRVEWDDCDVLWNGIRINVRASGYLQAWTQKRPSLITFTGLRGKEQGEDGSLSEADVYRCRFFLKLSISQMSCPRRVHLDISVSSEAPPFAAAQVSYCPEVRAQPTWTTPLLSCDRTAASMSRRVLRPSAAEGTSARCPEGSPPAIRSSCALKKSL